MKDRYTAQCAAGPFGVVGRELGIYGFEKRTHERDFQRRSDDVTFVVDIHD